MSESTVFSCAGIIQRAKCVCIFSGAGMSKDSGIETFRGSQQGFWRGIYGSMALIYGGTPFGWNLTPGYVWSYFVSSFYKPIIRASPHEGYHALARLEREVTSRSGRFSTITMNVDGFHQLSGADENSVFEIHGTVRRFRCIKCSSPINIADPLLDPSNPARCVSCGGHPRPDVTLFTEALPSNQWSGAVAAVSELSEGDVMIVVGTSSVVYPAASLPTCAKAAGAVLIEINPDETTPLSSVVDYHLRGTAAQMLPLLVEAVSRSDSVTQN